MSGLELLEVPRREAAIPEVPLYVNVSEHVYDTVLDDTDSGDVVDGQRSSEYNEHTNVEEHMENVTGDENYETSTVPIDQPEQIETETDEDMSDYSKTVGRYNLIIERSDIRNSKTLAIVCPENEGFERGGLLAASIKCTFRQSYDERKLSKIQKHAIATTEYTTDSGTMQYILHVLVPVWKEGADEMRLEKALKDATTKIFDKLTRHKKRNISDIAIPLLGIGKY